MLNAKQWFQAIKANDLEFVETNVQEYKKTVDSNYPYYTGLIQATAYGHTRMVRLLVDYEARVATRTGWTALMMAAETNNIALTRLLISHEKGMQTIRPTNHYRVGTTALLVAASKGHVEISRILYEYEAKVSNWNPLFLAALTHNLEDVQANLGSGPLRVDTYNRTPLMYCVMHQHSRSSVPANDLLNVTRIIEVLGPLNEGNVDYYGKTALIYATEANNSLAVEALQSYAKKEIGCKTVSMDGKTALMIAAELGYTRICSLLMANEGRMMTSKGFTALMYAVVNGRTEIVQLLGPLEQDMHIIDDVPPFKKGMNAIDIAEASNAHNIVTILKGIATSVQSVSIDAPSINLERTCGSEDYSRTSEMSNLLSLKTRHGVLNLRNPLGPQNGASLWSPSLSYNPSYRLTDSLENSKIENRQKENKININDELTDRIPILSQIDPGQVASVISTSTPSIPIHTKTYSILNKLNRGVPEQALDNDDIDELGRYLTRKQKSTGISIAGPTELAQPSTEQPIQIELSSELKTSDAETSLIEPLVIPPTNTLFSKKTSLTISGAPSSSFIQNTVVKNDFAKQLSSVDLSMNNTMAQITEQLKSTKNLLNHYAIDNMKLLDTINDLRAELQQEMDDKQILINKLTALKSQEIASQSAANTASLQFKEYEKRYSELKKSNAESELRIAELYTENVELKSELDEYKKQVDVLLRNNDDIKKKLDRTGAALYDTRQTTLSNPLGESALAASSASNDESTESKRLAADIKDLKQELAELMIKKELLTRSIEGFSEKIDDKRSYPTQALPQHIVEDILVDHHKIAIFMTKYNKYIHIPGLPPTIRQFLINNKLFLNDMEVERQENERITEYTVYLREEVSSLKERIGKYESSLMSRGL